jgi:hypothetical protein
MTAKSVTQTASKFDFPNREEIKSATEVMRWLRPMRTNLRSTHHQPTITMVGPLDVSV